MGRDFWPTLHLISQVYQPITTRNLYKWIGFLDEAAESNLTSLAPMLEYFGYDPKENKRPDYTRMGEMGKGVPDLDQFGRIKPKEEEENAEEEEQKVEEVEEKEGEAECGDDYDDVEYVEYEDDQECGEDYGEEEDEDDEGREQCS